MSTAPLAFTGVSTFSNDFQTILSRQVQIAQIPITALQNHQTDNAQKIQLLGALNDAVAGLGSSVAHLGAIGASKGLLASSSDAAISVTNTGATAPVTYTLSNITLATQASETSIAGYADSSSTTLPSNLQLVVGSNSYAITLGAGKNNLTGLRDAINASGAAVTANILTTGTGATPNYLMVTANNTGATTLQLNDVTDATAPVALLNHARAISESSANTYADPANTAVSSNNTLQLLLGTNSYDITLGPLENNLNGLASELNNIAGHPVSASVVTSNGVSSLVVTASQLGATSMQLNDIPASGPPTNLLSSVNNNASQGSNATFKLNGISVSKTTNSINDVIPGVTFKLLSAPESSTVTLSLNSDRSELTAALSDLVTKYNVVAAQLEAQVGPSAGLLNADYAVQAIADDMRQLTTYQVQSSSVMSLAALGITFDSAGRMSFDMTALSALSDSQLAAAFAYLGSSTTGFGNIAKSFTQMSDPTSGLIKAEQDGLSTANRRLTDQIGDLNTRLSAMQTALNRRLQMADAAVASLQSQQQVLTASVQAVDLALYGKNWGTAASGG